MDREAARRQSAWAQRPVDKNTIHAPEKPPEWPRWAKLALDRGEPVPGKFLPMWARWYDTCPICQAVVFLSHPFLMPAWEEVVPEGKRSDLLEFGPRSLNRPAHPIKFHPHRYFEEHKNVSWETFTLITQGEQENGH